MTRLGAPLYAPTLVTKPTETTPNAEAVPARPGADRHALDHKPPGVSSIARVSSTRADRARPMVTQRAALPYQRSAGRACDGHGGPNSLRRLNLDGYLWLTY